MVTVTNLKYQFWFSTFINSPTMSKLSIRPRNLDACKFIPIYKCEEIPDLHDYASINRSIPQLPTGMEKEEESVKLLIDLI